MPGIYIHVPFCKKRCIYCDFYSTTRSEMRDRYVDALCEELRQRRDYLPGRKVSTVYFGGGTPSQLSEANINKVFVTLAENFLVEPDAEITFEANPDDMTDELADFLAQTPVNRVSMGVQSFDDSILNLLSRRHSAEQARRAVATCRKAGIGNVSIDLIYGLPGQTFEGFDADLAEAFRLEVDHLSAYALSYETGTKLWHMRRENEVSEAPEELSLEMYRLLLRRVAENGFEHYEISNFCKPGMFSRHNSAYWKGEPYLGVGASAHSFDGHSRRWNVADIDQYIIGVMEQAKFYEVEELSLVDRYNEYLQTGLRTREGVSLTAIRERFGQKLYDYCRKMIGPNLKMDRLKMETDRLFLSPGGLFVSDDVISDLFYVD
ncbi:MAG: radical SAM family heme chaperone HemW [Bacteroidaceae bacterium]|nr:radical SAM family heme chaperone HemW [Bacteroidaceae bacterium]